MSEQKPTIGRIVQYRPTEKERELWVVQGSNDQKELPAVIVAVWSDTVVNLKVMKDGSGDVWQTSIEQGEGEGQWDWFTIVK
jgi:hypothetical protein